MKNSAPLLTVLTTLAILGGCTASEEISLQEGGGLKSLSKNPPPPEKLAELANLAKEVGPYEAKAREDLAAGRWQQALDSIDAAESKRNAFGINANEYLNERAEALIGLGRPKEALSLINPRPDVHLDPLTEGLARALLGQIDADTALSHANAAQANFSSFGDPPRILRPINVTQIVACIRLERAVANQSSDLMAEREAREVLKGYPKQPIASYILAKALGYQGKWKEAEQYWEPATLLPGPAGKEARAVCHNLYPDRKEFAPPPPRTLAERSGPPSAELLKIVEEQRQKGLHPPGNP